MTDSERYVLATGAEGASRLQMLETLYGTATEGLLHDLGVTQGMRVADVGCGVGTVVSWLGQRVGPTGTVVGVDLSDEQLAVARQRAEGLGLGNVELVQASAYATGLERGGFDVVFCRSLLSHLRDPLAAVTEMASLVRPGGTLLCEDIDMATIRTEPPSPAYDRVVALFFELGRVQGCDYRVGRHLADLLAVAGLTDVRTRHDQPAPVTGSSKRWWELTFLETVPAMIASGIVTPDEVARLEPELAVLGVDATTVIYQPAHFQAWGTVGAAQR